MNSFNNLGGLRRLQAHLAGDGDRQDEEEGLEPVQEEDESQSQDRSYFVIKCASLFMKRP